MFLLRSRLRANNSSSNSKKKQALMAENTTIHHHNTAAATQEQNQSAPFTSFLNSPRFFGGFLSRTISDEISSPPTPSPTSILANHPHHHPFSYDKNIFKPSSPNNNQNHTHPFYEQKQGIGLALLQDDKNRVPQDYDCNPTNNKKMVLFAAKLKVEVPPFFTSDVTPKSPGDFGIKTKNPPQLLRSLSINSPASKRGRSSSSSSDHHQEAGGGGGGGVVTLSVTEMEMSEEYTCVITHGPNPKITHIFDDTVVESSVSPAKNGNLLLLADQQKDNVDVMTSLPVDFLGFCYACNNKLDDEKDIYMFRGEKAFCSEECRFQEMNSGTAEDSYQF